MFRKLFHTFAIGVSVLLLASTWSSAGEILTHEQLVQRAEELMDAVRTGNSAPWKKYFADDCMYFSEKGKNMDKANLMIDVESLPKGYELKFKIENTQSRIFEETAILSYDIDEDLKIYGQQLGARFHATDIWTYRNGQWQIVATQMFRYYGDPAVGEVNTQEFTSFAGTYELVPGMTATVFVEDGKLFYQRADRPRELLEPEAPRIFFRKGVEGRTLFRYDSTGKVDALISRRNHEDILWKKIR